MKSLFVVALLVASASCMPAMMQDCLTQNSATSDDLLKFADGGEASQGIKCYMKCIMLGMKTMTEDGKLLVEPMLENFPPAQHDAVKECCTIDQGGELCDLAFRHNMCLRDKMPEMYKTMMHSRVA